MKQNNIFKYLKSIEEAEKESIKGKIDEVSLHWLHDNKYITYQKLQGNIMHGPFLLDEGRFFLENFDETWKGYIEREWGKYRFIHNNIYLPLLGFLLGVLLTKIGIFGEITLMWK